MRLEPLADVVKTAAFSVGEQDWHLFCFRMKFLMFAWSVLEYAVTLGGGEHYSVYKPYYMDLDLLVTHRPLVQEIRHRCSP